VILELTKSEYTAYESLSDDGYEDGEIVSELINVFGFETRVVKSSQKAKAIMAGVAS
jgi:hypothetical protein